MSEEAKRATESCETASQVSEQEDAAAEGEELLANPEALLEMVLAEHAAQEADALPARIDGVVVGKLVAIDQDGAPRVSFLGHAEEEGVPARSAAAIGREDVGREVALMFERGDPQRPLIMATMFVPQGERRPTLPQAQVDSERLELTADKEIVLRCGKASITLTRAGKILIRGAYVLARSSGVNRIQGGSVQIN